ncbi:MAG: hypothetical protein H6842_04245 [Rhodospirillaceae bacterium]|nr:hypothetical protein [Rhodospirillaceae bacterium]
MGGRHAIAWALGGLLAIGLSVGEAYCQDAAVLTVSGAIDHTNRPAFDPFRDAFFGYHGIAFDNAYQFSAADLAALPQQRLEVTYPVWIEPTVTVEGPRLLDVLDTVGATGDTVTLTALDGFAVTLDRAHLTGAFVLAVGADCTPDGCTPLGLGGRGPVWLVFPPGAYPDYPGEDDDGLAWAVFHIQVD